MTRTAERSKCMKKQKKLKLPKFKNEDEERDYWAKFDLSKYASAKDLVPISFPNLKPTSRPISIRLPVFLLVRIKEKANELDIPYQSLIKKYIAQGVLKNS